MVDVRYNAEIAISFQGNGGDSLLEVRLRGPNLVLGSRGVASRGDRGYNWQTFGQPRARDAAACIKLNVPKSSLASCA